MTPLKTIAYRLPQDLIEKIDAYAAKRAARDGRPCSRSEAIRLLLEKGLDVLERDAWSESITGKITDTFESPPNKKKKTQPPRRRQDRTPGVAFNQATERLESPPKKNPEKKGTIKWPDRP